MIAGASGTELGADLDTCDWTCVWIRKESRQAEDEKTEGDGDGDEDGDGRTTLTSSSKLIRGVRGIVSLRGLSASYSHSERAGVEGVDDPVGESG